MMHLKLRYYICNDTNKNQENKYTPQMHQRNTTSSILFYKINLCAICMNRMEK